MNVYIRPLVKMLGVIRVAAAHDGVGDDGIDFNPGNALTPIRHRAKHIYTAAGANDGIVPVWPEHVHHCRWRGH